MKAMIWTAPEEMTVQEMPVPEVGPGEVTVRVKAVGICGSELEGYLGHNSLRRPPLQMGHEFAGIVETVGEGVPAELAGRRVTVNPLSACGHCRSCLNGRPQLCADRRIVGIHRSGAFAEYVTVPADSLHELPPGVSFVRGALTEPLACSLRAARKALEGRAPANVLVIGAGAIGILSAMSARLLGASAVYVTDKNQSRLDTVRRLGIAESVAAGEAFETRLGELAGPRGIDAVIDAVGFAPTRELAVRVVNPGGAIAAIGLGENGTSLPVNDMIRSEIEIKGSFCYTPADFTDALYLLGEHRVTEEGWTEIRGLDDGPRSFRELVRGETAAGKIILELK